MKMSAPIFRLKRQAKAAARERGIPLHAALDRIALAEGFRNWSHLSAMQGEADPATALFAELMPGEMVLLAARPGQGKTLLGLALAVEAAKAGRAAWFFSLEDSEAVVRERLGEPVAGLTIDTSDAISADHVIARMAGGGFAVIDYLQILDQRRSVPELGEQVAALRAFARTSGATIVLLSQIDRSFDGAMPGPGDVRLPNPVDLALFDRHCFLHDGRLACGAPPS